MASMQNTKTLALNGYAPNDFSSERCPRRSNSAPTVAFKIGSLLQMEKPHSFRSIPVSLQNPKLLVRDDTEVVGDGVAPCAPLAGKSSSEEVVDGPGEEVEGFVEPVVGHLAVQDAP